MRSFYRLGVAGLLLSLGFNSGFSLKVSANSVSSYMVAQRSDLGAVEQLLQQVKELFTQGQYAEAVPLAERAVAIARRQLSPQDPKLAIILGNLAGLYLDHGRYSEAEPLYKEALTIARIALPKNHPQLATHLGNLAGLYQAQGRYSEAEPLYKEALAIVRNALPKNHPRLATHLSNFATLYQAQGRYSEAEPLLKEALAIDRSTLPKNHPYLGTSLSNLATLYQTQGRYSEAEPLYKEALAIVRNALSENHPQLASHLSNFAVLYQRQGRYSEAEPLAKEALSIARTTLPKNHFSLAMRLHNLSVLRWAQNDLPTTLQLFQEGLEIEEENLSRNLAVGNEQQKQAFLSLYRGSIDQAISIHQQFAPNNSSAARLAFITILRRKGRLLDVLGQSFQRLRNSSDPTIQTQLTQLTQVHSQLSNLTSRGPGSDPSQYQQALQQLTTQQQQLTTSLGNANPELAQVFQPVSIPQIQAALPPNSALIEFIEYRPYNPKAKPKDTWEPPRYAVYVLTPSGELSWADLGPTSKIKPLLDNFINLVQKEDSGKQTQSFRKAALRLYAWIMKPVRQLVGNATHLLIAPDGELNQIPFEAFMDEEGKYLIESYQFTYLTSGRDLLRLQNPLPKAEPSLLLADPNYDQRDLEVADTRGSNQRSTDIASLSFGALPWTLKEGKAIEQIFPFQTYTGTEATETVVKQHDNPGLLHIATHGFFLEEPTDTAKPSTPNANLSESLTSPPLFLRENPLLRSGLALAGFNQHNQHRQGDDGVLTALEVSGLDLRATQMVVLSACETGLGQVQSGEGVYGLRRALTLAGARSQLMSLWNVRDDSTKELMVAYYQRLKQGQGRGEALRQVQLEMIAGKFNNEVGKNYTAPYYWAPFVRVGDWRPLQGF